MSIRRLSLAAALALTACYPKPGPVPGPLNATSLDTAQKRFPDSTPAQFEQGQAIFSKRCGECHASPDLAPIAEAEWRPIVERMGGRMDLDAASIEAVYRFIIAARGSSAPAP